MAKIEFTDWTGAGRSRWAADYRDRDHLVPGGVKLDATAFGAADADTGKITVKSGTAISRAADGDPFHPAVAAEEVYLLAFDVEDLADNNDGVLYRPGSVVKINLLPEAGAFGVGVEAEIRSRYVCQEGVR